MKDVLFCYNIHSVYFRNSTTLNYYSKKLIFTLRNSLITSSLRKYQAELLSFLSSDPTGRGTVCYLKCASRSARLSPGERKAPCVACEGSGPHPSPSPTLRSPAEEEPAPKRRGRPRASLRSVPKTLWGLRGNQGHRPTLL